MRIVCFSFLSLPLSDPEAYCTARFLSALARAGADVTLLTVVHPDEVDPSACAELQDPAINVVRLPLDKSKTISIGDAVRYGFVSWHAVHLKSLIEGVRRHLSSHSESVLISRSFPAISNVVAYHARDLARLWVAHFSDPYPGLQMYSGRMLHWRLLDSRWAKRILRSADLVTVTNRNAMRWFREVHGAAARGRFHVAYHVGGPPLDHDDVDARFDPQLANFVHVGFWPRRRYLAEVFGEFGFAHASNGRIALHHFGQVEPGVAEEIRTARLPWLRLVTEPMSPRFATAVLESRTVNVVVDQADRLPYCPYLASKFAYAVTSGRPLLAIGQADSEMSRLAREYGSFYFADVTQPGSLRRTLLEMTENGIDKLAVPSARLRSLFAPEDVADKFVAVVEGAMAGYRRFPARRQRLVPMQP